MPGSLIFGGKNMKKNKIPKIVNQCILFFSISLIGGFTGKTIYDILNKPDGYLYLDKDTKAIYAQMKKDPDSFKKGSKLLFEFKG